MIVASFLHKLSPYYSLGRWLITTGLHRYLPPSDKLLRPHIATPAPANKNTKKKVANQREKILSSPNSSPAEILAAINYQPNALDQNIAVPKSANLKLTSTPLTWDDLNLLHFSSELEFMINLMLAAVVIFCATILYYYLRPSATGSEYNLSVIWIAVVLGYTFRTLFTLTKIYLSEELARQRSLCIVFTMLLFVCALGVLLIDESVLDFGLEKSHKDISKSLSVLLEGFLRDTKDFQIMPMWSFKILLAFLCGFISMTLIFPGFRFADTHFSAIRFSKIPLFKTLLHANYIAPMFCLSLWIRPLSQDLIAERSYVNIFGLAELSYGSFRVATLVSVCLLRVCLFRTYLQSYLDTAKWKVENLKQEQGRITISNLRKKVSNIFSFYAALGIQYIAPYVILLCVTLILSVSMTSNTSPIDQGISSSENVNIFRSSGLGTSSFQGCIAFVCWWVCFTNAVTSGFGAILKEFI